MAEANFQVLGQQLQAMGQHVELIHNLPPPPADNINIMNALNEVLVRLDNLSVQVDHLLARYVTLAISGVMLNLIFFHSQQCLPMRLYNATLSFDAELQYPLQYPAGVPVIPIMARMKRQLISLSVADAQVVAQVLHLPALDHPLVVDRRNQILKYLSCALRA